MIPSGQETKLRNRIGWAVHELKEIDAVHYPEPAYRALTTLGSEIDEDRIKALRTEFEANKRRNQPGEIALSPVAEKHHEPEGSSVAVDVKNMVERFLKDTDYPTESDKEQKRLRNEWAEKLAPESVAFLSRSDLRAITNNALRSGDYVRQVEGGAKWLSGLDDVKYSRLLDNIKYLCWGEGDLSVRFDRLAVWGGYNRVTGTKGFAGWNASAILAVCHPERFIPTKAQRGKYGRLRMLTALGLPIPHNCSTFAQEVVAANDRLREHLSPYFDDDPHAIAAFLYWILARDDNSRESETEEYKPDLAELAASLLVSPGFLKDIVSLLEDKGQVILYGPPGTGKTYLARELARTLASDESCRALVQFHPSTSYEDFFEGYRPAGTGDDGTIRFELTAGPLARMAAQASEAPDRQHVMIIDEINRGNLPRVLGELLFLLEYRNESVQTLYRPEEPFALPENLWFIGTMNTADRSIALVDAALRRRFHFVPFFPDREPMAGLLGRWLDREDEPAWVGHLVDAVNDELKTELEGSHLLLGPSHFMKEYGDSPDEQHEQLRRIWEYNIEPFIEDQFFGAPDRIEYFRFNAVMKRHGPESRSDTDITDGDGDPAGAGASGNAGVGTDGDA